MEDLRKYRVDFRVTFHCIGKKGLFRKKEYTFDYVLEKDPMLTIAWINARNSRQALTTAKTRVEKQTSRLVKRIYDLKDGDFLTISGNVPPNGNFKRSSKIYGIIGVDIDLIKIIDCGAWKEQTVKYAMEHLSIEEFKSVFGETLPKQEEE